MFSIAFIRRSLEIETRLEVLEFIIFYFLIITYSSEMNVECLNVDKLVNKNIIHDTQPSNNRYRMF